MATEHAGSEDGSDAEAEQAPFANGLKRRCRKDPGDDSASEEEDESVSGEEDESASEDEDESSEAQTDNDDAAAGVLSGTATSSHWCSEVM